MKCYLNILIKIQCHLVAHRYQLRHLLQMGTFLYLTLYRHSLCTDSKDKTNHPEKVLYPQSESSSMVPPLPPTKKVSTFPSSIESGPTSSIPPIPPVPSLPTKIGVPSIPLFPSVTIKSKPNPKPKVPMKHLNWTKLPVGKISRTIWEKIDDSHVRLNEELLLEKFSIKEATTKTSQTKKDVNTKQIFCKPERQRNIKIVLSKLHITDPLVLAYALMEYNTEIITPVVCEMLLSIVPTMEEYTEIKKQTEHLEPSEYDISDMFIGLIGEIPGYKERLTAIVFKSNYRLDSVNILKTIDCFYKAFDFISSNEHLHKLFEVILAHGNYMNGVTPKGGALGFKMESLPKLSQLRSRDNRKTLLQYIIYFIINDMKEPEVLDIMPYFELFKKSKL